VAAAALKAGELNPLLQDYLPQRQGLFLYFPARAQSQPKLRAFFDVARRALRGER
jgi:DNA-binding transcriptional LysR family regulator